MVERGLKPAAISWKGAKGFAFMYFDTRANNLPSATSGQGGGEELVEKLKDLKIGDTVLNIEQDRRSSKKNSTKDGADQWRFSVSMQCENVGKELQIFQVYDIE